MSEFVSILERIRPGYANGGLIQKDFIELYEKFPGGSDAEFSEFIEKEKGVKLKPKTVNERRRRANLKIKLKEGQSLKGTAPRLTDNQVASEAKKLGIDTKGKNVKTLRRQISSVRLREKRKTDPDARLKKAKLSKEYRKKITERRRTDPEFNIKEREKIREQRRLRNAKNPRAVSVVPHEMTPKGLLFKDLTTQAMRNQKGMLPNSHIKFKNPDQKRPTGIAKAKEVQLIDTKVLDANGRPKVITYKNVIEHIDDNQKLYGTDSKSTLAEYDKKITINRSGLRNKFNEVIYGESYKSATSRGKQSFAPFHVHHPAGRSNNAFNVQFAVGSDNMKENGLRASLDSEFKGAKTFGDKRRAVKKYLDNAPKNLEVRLKRTPYGVRETLTEITKRVSPELGRQLFKVIKTAGKVVKPLGIATGLAAVNTAVKAGEKNPFDLVGAYITADPQVATDARRMRQEPEFRKQQIAGLPQIMPEGFEMMEEEDFTSFRNGGIVAVKGVI